MEAATAGQGPAGVVAGAGGSEGAPGAEPGQEPGAEAAEADPLAEFRQSVDTRLDGALDAIRQMAQTVNQRLPEPQAEAQPTFDEQFNELLENAPGGVIDPSDLSGLIENSNKQAIEKALAPFQQQMQAFQQAMTAQELQGLQTSFPELADQKTADMLADNVVNEVVALQVPEQIAEGLLHNAKFVRLVHLAGKAEAAARGETPAGGQQQVPSLETGGGAAPGSSGGDEWETEFANAGRKGPPVW